MTYNEKINLIRSLEEIRDKLYADAETISRTIEILRNFPALAPTLPTVNSIPSVRKRDLNWKDKLIAVLSKAHKPLRLKEIKEEMVKMYPGIDIYKGDMQKILAGASSGKSRIFDRTKLGTSQYTRTFLYEMRREQDTIISK